MGNRELWSAMREKEELLASADESFDTDRYADLEEIVLQHDGYIGGGAAARSSRGWASRPRSTHSRSRRCPAASSCACCWLRCWPAEPDVLLLDEPTNHLDILSIRWLEKFLQGFKGIVVVISHDHRFLDNVCTHILDVDYETVVALPGNYTAFVAAKVDERDRKEGEIAKREREIEHHKAFVERFRAKATKARQAKSKQKLIERVGHRAAAAELAPLPDVSASTRCAQRQGRSRIDGLSKAFGDNQVLSDVSLTVRRGDRLAIMGPNGIGKSTLLKIAMGELEPTPAPSNGATRPIRATSPRIITTSHRAAGDGRELALGRLPGRAIGFVKGRLAHGALLGRRSRRRSSATSRAVRRPAWSSPA